MKVAISGAARQDLREIARHIAKDDPAAAFRTIDRIERRCAELADFPLSGSVLRATGADLRRTVVGSYMVIYAVDEHVEILRVLHAARDIDPLLDEV